MFTRATGIRPQPSTFGTRQQSAAATPSFLPLRIQPKLIVGPVDDPFEREADQMAERVVQHIPGPPLSPLGPGLSQTIQRACEDDDGDDCPACQGESCESCMEEETEELEEPEEPKQSKKRRHEEITPSTQPIQEPEIKQQRKKVKLNVRRAALSMSTPHLAETIAAPDVEAGIRRAQGGGRPLPESVRGTMERAFTADFRLVRVHSDGESDRLSRSLAAHAFTAGQDIFFKHGEYRPESRAGQRLLAHELTHVVQQGGAGPGGGRSGVGAPVALQRKYADLSFGGSKSTDKYPGHTIQFPGGAKGKTGCGIKNQITTAGEKLAKGTKSDPGTPIGIEDYYGSQFSTTPGLLLDPSVKRKQCVTKMHIINHRLQDDDHTQRNPKNIFLGTLRSNGSHKSNVEMPIFKNLLEYGSEKNNDYETAMANAKETTHNTNKVWFWPKGKKPAAGVAPKKDIKQAYLTDDDLTKGVQDKDSGSGKDVEGVMLAADYKPDKKFRHLWVVYEVAANYSAPPTYVNDNVQVETDANLKDDGKGNMVLKDADLDKVITEFKTNWAKEAFPPTFDCRADLYSASFDPAGHYFKEPRSETLRTDIV